MDITMACMAGSVQPNFRCFFFLSDTRLVGEQDKVLSRTHIPKPGAGKRVYCDDNDTLL